MESLLTPGQQHQQHWAVVDQCPSSWSRSCGHHHLPGIPGILSVEDLVISSVFSCYFCVYGLWVGIVESGSWTHVIVYVIHINQRCRAITGLSAPATRGSASGRSLGSRLHHRAWSGLLWQAADHRVHRLTSARRHGFQPVPAAEQIQRLQHERYSSRQRSPGGSTLRYVHAGPVPSSSRCGAPLPVPP